MQRRVFVVGMAAVILSRVTAEGQQTGKLYKVAVMGLQPPQTAAPFLQALRDGLRNQGYIDGRNAVLDYVSADGRAERLPDIAAETVRQNYDVIVTSTNEVTAAAKRATATVPIVMTLVVDPVRAGFATSIAKPGGNITGLTLDANPEGYAKPIEFIKELLPGIRRVAVLKPPGFILGTVWATAEATASKIGVELRAIDVRAAADIGPAFVTMRREGLGAFIWWPDGSTYPARTEIADLAISNRLVGTSVIRQFPEVGGLFGYGPSIFDLYRRAAVFIDKIFRGAAAGDLPIEQPMKFELLINLKTAKALGLTIPPSLLLRADHVIE